MFSKFNRKTLELMAEAVRDGKLVIPISPETAIESSGRGSSNGRKRAAGKILLVA